MPFPFSIATALAVFVLVAAVCTLTSRTAIERLVGMGVLPRMFINAVPILTLAGRALAIVMILFGTAEVGFTTGILSHRWLEQYGFSTLLLVLGAFLLVVTFRKPTSR